jgi:sulfite reductase (ferredoxin)
MLLTRNITPNSHVNIIKEFDAQFKAGKYRLHGSFEDLVLSINKKEPEKLFAQCYYLQSSSFLNTVKTQRYNHGS